MDKHDPYWDNAATMLKKLLAAIPGVDVAAISDDPQAFLAAYQPAPGQWTDEQESARKIFLKMGRTQFKGVWDTYLENAAGTQD
jgi:hypothetical protein